MTILNGAPLDEEGLHVERPDTISTFTGRRVAPLAMTVDDLDIEDVAHALSHICRYGGHSAGHLSVARHSIWVSQWVEAQLAARGDQDTKMVLTALLHDAAEAYLGDIVRPLKRTDAFATYLDAEADLERVLAEKFGTYFPIPELVREGDRFILTHHELADHTGDDQAGARRLWDADWQQDRSDFLQRFNAARSIIRPWIIGLSGYAGSGKDTLGQVLVDHDGRERAAFADIMRQGLYNLNPLVAGTFGTKRVQELVDELGWDQAKRLYPEIRALMQKFGTEAGRDIHGQDCWVDRTMALLDRDTDYVITDVRFPNELDAVHAAGGQVWRIDRQDIRPASVHPSETGLDDATFDRTFTPPIVENGAQAQLWYMHELGLDRPVD